MSSFPCWRVMWLFESDKCLVFTVPLPHQSRQRGMKVHHKTQRLKRSPFFLFFLVPTGGGGLCGDLDSKTPRHNTELHVTGPHSQNNNIRSRDRGAQDRGPALHVPTQPFISLTLHRWCSEKLSTTWRRIVFLKRTALSLNPYFLPLWVIYSMC